MNKMYSYVYICDTIIGFEFKYNLLRRFKMAANTFISHSSVRTNINEVYKYHRDKVRTFNKLFQPFQRGSYFK